MKNKPVTIAVRWLASIPSVTSSAVEFCPKPEGPVLENQFQRPIQELALKMCFCSLLGELNSKRWGRAGPSWPLFLVGFHLFFFIQWSSWVQHCCYLEKRYQ